MHAEIQGETLHDQNLSLGFPTRSNANRAVQSQKIARGLKFRTSEVQVDGLYYLWSENKGADQLHGYHTGNPAADLPLCVHIFKKQVFS